MKLHPTIAFIRANYRQHFPGQRQLSERAGLSFAYTSAILRGRRGGSFAAIEALLGAIGYNLEITNAHPKVDLQQPRSSSTHDQGTKLVLRRQRLP